jgi:transposase InsO family protein
MEECVWQQTFQTVEEARQRIRGWVQWYNHGRPHSALGYRVRSNTVPNNQPRWLDFRGALHPN